MLKKFLYLILCLKLSGTIVYSLEEANVNFSTAIFRAVVKLRPNENVIISPYFIQRELALFLQAVSAKAYDQLKTVMAIDDFDDVKIEDFFKRSPNQLKNFGNIYYPEESKLRTRFATLANEYFNQVPEPSLKSATSKLVSLEFMNQVNANIKRQSKGRILNYFGDEAINIDTYSLIFANALHLMAEWEQTFDRHVSPSLLFYGLGSDVGTYTPFVHGIQNVGYVELREMDATAIQLPFKNSDLKMIFILPKSDRGEKNLWKTIEFESIASRMKIKTVSISIPKIQLSFGTNLEVPLRNIGATKMFTTGVDVSKAFKQPPTNGIPYLYHRILFDLDEFGSDVNASRQQAILNDPTKVFTPKTPQHWFICDKPFIILLHDNRVVHMAGRIVSVFSGMLVKNFKKVKEHGSAENSNENNNN